MPIVVPQLDATIPDGITDLEAFRRWARSEEFPEHGRFAFFNGNVWMDLSMEQGYSHNQVKFEIGATLRRLVKSKDLGLLLTDGMLLTNIKAGLSTVPDGIFVSHESFKRGTVRKRQGDEDDFVELVGSPDMVLEVISTSSEEKDTAILFEQYSRAGISEYWLADARHGASRLDIYRMGSEGYVLGRKLANGWSRSMVFASAFRLTRSWNRAGDPVCTLEMR